MQQLDPKAVWLFFLSSLTNLLLFFIFLCFWSLSMFSGFIDNINLTVYIFWALLILAILIFLAFVWAKLSYRFYRYELLEDGFRKESGVITKRYVTIPYDRIQNIDIYRGILARILGLSDLQIQTAGSSAVMSNRKFSGVGAEGRLPALSFETAEKLRDELVKRAKNSKNQGI